MKGSAKFTIEYPKDYREVLEQINSSGLNELFEETITEISIEIKFEKNDKEEDVDTYTN
ncbi:TPA: hypothetical protein RSW61_001928 [Vibrio harveyi]|nr:hypothetical protein [Vibrio harveyi]